MSAPKALIEKMCLALTGETPTLVVQVLPSFVATICATFGVSIEDFIVELREHAAAAEQALERKGPAS